MTREELERIPALNEKIGLLKTEIGAMDYEYVADTAKDYRTGYGRTIKIKGYAIDEERREEKEKKLKRMEAEHERMTRKMEDWMETLEEEMSTLIRLRYRNNLSWQNIVRELGRVGDGSTERKKVYKFLDNQ